MNPCIKKYSTRLGRSVASMSKCGFASVPPPRLFDYATIVKHLKPTPQSIGAIESAFGMLSKGLVDVPIPMVCAIIISYDYLIPFSFIILYKNANINT